MLGQCLQLLIVMQMFLLRRVRACVSARAPAPAARAQSERSAGVPRAAVDDVSRRLSR